MPKYRPLAYTGQKATDSKSGQSRFATATEGAAGTREDLMISPKILDSAVESLIADGTTTVKGIVRLATVAETQAGLLATVANTPAGLAAVAIAGAPNWSESVSGIGQLSTAAEAVALTNDTTAMTPAKVALVLASPSAIGGTAPAAIAATTLSTTGLASLGASATIVTGAVALNLGADASTGAINAGTGAAARVITIGNVTGATAVNINSGTAGVTIASTGAGDITSNAGDKFVVDAVGTIDLNSSAAAINIGNDDVDQAVNIATDGERTLTIGSANGAAAVVVQGGTSGITIGNNAIAQSVTIGNQTGASALALEIGTGNFTLNGVASSTYTVGASTTTGTISIGGTSQTGTMTLAGGDGAQAVNIANSTGGKTVAIASGAGANAVTLGSTNTTSATTINAGSGGLTFAAGGIVDMVPATSTAAAATGTINANVGVTTHTGLTTASAASQVFTITNSVCGVGSAVFVSASNLGANDAQMTVTRVTPAAGSFTVTLTNNGAAALNGDVILTFWIIAA